MRTIAVTGASGAIGRLVVEHLGQDPGVETVIAIDRSKAPTVPVGVRFVQHDLADADLKPLLHGVDAVVHLAWERPVREDLVPGARSRSVQATRCVLDAAASSGVDHIVFVSSATVYGAWPGNSVPLTEEVPLRPNPGLAHAVEKAEAERLVAEWRDDHPGSTAAVLRPTVVVAHDEADPFGMALAGVGLRPDEATRPVQFVHREDVASAVLVALRSRLDGVFNVAPDGWIPDETMRALAGGPARIAVPAAVARPLRAIGRLVGASRPWPGTAPYSRHPWVVANDRLRSAGWTPQHSNEEAFVDSGGGSRWQGLSPRRRQEAALLGAAAAVGGVVVGAAALVRRRARR